MKNFRTQKTLLVYAVIVLMLSAINILVLQYSQLLAVALLPVSFYAILMFLVRLVAPFVVRKKILDYLDTYGGEVSFDALMNRFAGNDNPRTAEANAQVLTPIISDLEDCGLILISENMVKRCDRRETRPRRQ